MQVLKKIGKYRYSQRHCLGQGSFGKVFQGYDQSNTRVAIKKIQQRVVATDPYLKSSLNTQISVMKKLKHKNIVQLIDTVITQNSIYLILQYCSGGDLRTFINGKKFTQQQVKKIMRQIIDGFQVIVKQNIIHRDLKPANILVHEGVFKICDFGFAKYFSQLGRMAKTVVGTPIYMSPQVLKHKPYTSKADLWSLGVIYYELLFRRLPYVGRSEEEIYRMVVKSTLSFSGCSEFSFNFLKNTLVIEQTQRWDWAKVFEHFGNTNSQTKPNGIIMGFYQNFFGNNNNNQVSNNNIVIDQNNNKNMVFNNNNQAPYHNNKNDSFNNNNKKIYNNNNVGGYNMKFISDEPPQKQRDDIKSKPQKMARNILAQDLQRNNQGNGNLNNQQQYNNNNFQYIQQNQQNLNNIFKIQKFYNQREIAMIRRLYFIAVQFSIKSHFYLKYQNFSPFLYSLINYSLNQYMKLAQNMQNFPTMRKLVLGQQKIMLQRILGQLRAEQQIGDLHSTAAMFQLQAKRQFTEQEGQWINQVMYYNGTTNK